MAEGGKICVFCGQDCAGRPRVKDPQGRYACKSCAADQPKGGASKAAPDTGPITNDDFGLGDGDIGLSMDDLLGDVAVSDSTPCPGCGHQLEAGAVVCMGCGYNLQTASSTNTRVSKMKVRKERSAPPISLGWVAMGLGLAGLIGLPWIGSTSESAAFGALLVANIWIWAAYIMMIVAAFKDDESKWGIIGLLTFVPVLGGIAGLFFLLYYCIFGSSRTAWKVNLWLALFAIIGVVVAAISSYPELLELE